MIVNGTLTHPFAAQTFWTWESSSPVLHAFTVAILTTILSYQLAAAIFDLCVGLKPAGWVSIRNLYMQLLADEASPLAVAAALLRNPTLARWHFHGFRAECPNVLAVQDARPRQFPSIAPKLLVLLLVAPVANLVAIVLSLERDSVVTFEDAKFGGVTFGVSFDNNTDVREELLMPLCTRYVQDVGRGETALASFLFCTYTHHRIRQSPFSLSMVQAEVDRAGQLWMRVLMQGSKIEQFGSAEMAIQERVYKIRTAVTADDLKSVVGTGQDILKRTCRAATTEAVGDAVMTGTREGGMVVTQQAKCPETGMTAYGALTAVAHMNRRLTLVESEELEVARVEDVEAGAVRYFDGRGLSYVSRHETFVSVAVLGLMTAAVTAARLVVKMVTNNDVYAAVEIMVKEMAAWPCCDSMLPSSDTVLYSDMCRVVAAQSK